MAPVISSLSCGPQASNQGNYGQTLTINGTELTGTVSARFGTRTVTATASSDTVATCVVPPGCGVVNVTVTAATGTSNARPFYYIDAPVLSGLSPVETSAENPGPVTITGSDLLTANQVQFAGTPGTLTPPTSDSSITATPAPVAEVGANPWFQTQPAAVRTAGGTVTVANAVTFYDTPTIATIEPTSGEANDEVIITGTGYVGEGVSVTFDGVEADFILISDLQILAFAPVGPTGDADVVVTTPGGASNAETFTYPA